MRVEGKSVDDHENVKLLYVCGIVTRKMKLMCLLIFDIGIGSHTLAINGKVF